MLREDWEFFRSQRRLLEQQLSQQKTSNHGYMLRFALLLPAVIITGSMAHSAKRGYLSYSEADFEVFRPTVAARCTDGGEIWCGGGDLRSPLRSPLPRQISPPLVQR